MLTILLQVGMMRNVHRNWLRCVGIGLNPSVGISRGSNLTETWEYLHTHMHSSVFYHCFLVNIIISALQWWVFSSVDRQLFVCPPPGLLVGWDDQHQPMPVQLPSWPPWLYDPPPELLVAEDIVSLLIWPSANPPPSVCVGSTVLCGHTYGLLWNGKRTDLELLSVAGQWIVKIATGPKWSEPKTFDCPEPKPIYGSTPPPCAGYG